MKVINFAFSENNSISCKTAHLVSENLSRDLKMSVMEGLK